MFQGFVTLFILLTLCQFAHLLYLRHSYRTRLFRPYGYGQFALFFTLVLIVFLFYTYLLYTGKNIGEDVEHNQLQAFFIQFSAIVILTHILLYICYIFAQLTKTDPPSIPKLAVLLSFFSHIMAAIITFTVIYSFFGIQTNGSEVFDIDSCFYYAVITMSTVGYGDFSPTEATRNWAAIQALFGMFYMPTMVALIFIR